MDRNRGRVGNAKAKSAAALTTVTSTASAQLYPGGSGDLLVTVANSNPYAVTLSSVTNKVGGVITSDKTGCDATTSGVTFSDTSSLTNVIPAGSAGTLVTLTGKVSMSLSSDNACQGAVFAIPVTLAGASS